MITNDFSSFKFGLGLKEDADELSDEEGDGAQANEDDAQAERADDDYFRGALNRSFAVGCPPSIINSSAASIEESKLGSNISSGLHQPSSQIEQYYMP